MIAGVTFINNKAVKKDSNEGSKDGGAIRSTWVLTVAGSTFTGNVSDNQGGAIMVQAGRMTIMDTAFTGNVTDGSLCASCFGAGGGAIATAASGNVYPFTIKRSTFQGNVALKVFNVEVNPSSGNQDQEYICVTNPAPFAVDISGWKITGGIQYTFKGGTVIASNSALYDQALEILSGS